MRKFSIFFCCLITVITLSAQQRTGNIYGLVVDQEGVLLPGVNLTLTGSTIGAMTVQSNTEGKFRFLSLFPGKEYQIKAELQGFKTKIEKDILVNVNRNSDIKIVLEQGKLEEQVTVVARVAMVQAKSTRITYTINYDQLQGLPSSRDPWSIIQMAPSIFVDRENTGGVESGGMSEFMAKGSTWMEFTMDGLSFSEGITGSGGTFMNFDFDSFEEINISTGMLDVENRRPGVVVNLVTRRGGNKTSLGGRFYYTNEQFQTKVSAARLKEIGVSGYNRALDIKDFGFNAGGPIITDKVWWWAAYGVQQIQTFNLLNVRDDTYLSDYLGKINFQLIPENRLELFYQASDKKKFGLNSTLDFPSGWNQHSKYYFGNPFFKIQDEHMFGDNMFVSIRYGSSNTGYGRYPANDETLTKPRWYDVEKNITYNSNTWGYGDTPHPFGVLQVQYFNDNLFGTGTSHEIKIGAETDNYSVVSTGGTPGNFYIRDNYYYETVDWNNDGKVDIVRNIGPNIKRIYVQSSPLVSEDGGKGLAFYFNDSVSIGRFNVNLGLRADRAKSYTDPVTTRSLWTSPGDNQFKNYADIAKQLFTPETITKIVALIPEKHRGYIEPGKLFWLFSPRVGLTYDVFGGGKTIAKAAYSLYPGGGLGQSYWAPYGLSGNMNFWWADLNNDGKANWDELYWANYGKSSLPVYRVFDDAGNFVGDWEREFNYNWSGWDLKNPTGLSKPTSYIDLDKWKTSLTHELFFSLEHEIIQDFGVSLSYSWKRTGRMSVNLPYYPEEFFPGLNNHLRSTDDWMVGGYIPDVLIDPATGKTFDPKESKGKPWYVLKNIPETASTAYTKTVMADPGRYTIYWGWDLVFNKRLSHKWMLNGSFTYQMQRAYYGNSFLRNVGDLTDKWAYDGAIFPAKFGFGTGKIDRWFFSRWMLKLSGIYQLPFDINLSGTLSAHEGSFYAETFGVEDRTLPNPRSYSNTMPATSYNTRPMLPNVWTLNLKVEKMIKLGETSRMYFCADIFNAINKDLLLRKYDISYGSFRFTGGPTNSVPYSRTAPSTTSGKPYEMMNPLLIRLGMRFQI